MPSSFEDMVVSEMLELRKQLGLLINDFAVIHHKSRRDDLPNDGDSSAASTSPNSQL